MLRFTLSAARSLSPTNVPFLLLEFGQRNKLLHYPTVQTKHPLHFSRCVFAKAANEVRTSSELMAKTNRFNVLAIIVKDHPIAKDRCRERCRNATAVDAPAASAATEATLNPKETLRQTKRTFDQQALPQRWTASCEHHGKVTPGKQTEQSKKSLHSAVPPEYSHDGCATPTPCNPSTASSHTHRSASPRKRSSSNTTCPEQRRFVSGAHAPPAPMMGQAGGFHPGPQKPGQFSLPPFDKRYGIGVVDSWVQSPVALRIGRPRPGSVSVMSLDRDALFECAEEAMRRGEALKDKRDREDAIPTESGEKIGDPTDRRAQLEMVRDHTVHFSHQLEIEGAKSTTTSDLGLRPVKTEEIHTSILVSDSRQNGGDSASRSCAIPNVFANSISRAPLGITKILARSASRHSSGTLPELFPPRPVATANNTSSDDGQQSRDSVETLTSRSLLYRNHCKMAADPLAVAVELGFRSNEARTVRRFDSEHNNNNATLRVFRWIVMLEH